MIGEQYCCLQEYLNASRRNLTGQQTITLCARAICPVMLAVFIQILTNPKRFLRSSKKSSAAVEVCTFQGPAGGNHEEEDSRSDTE